MNGIFSLGTMGTYHAAMRPFAKWFSAHNVKNTSQIIKAHAAAYLREREAAELSFRTVSRDMTTINKAMGFDFNKKDLGLRSEKKSEITHSLEETENDRPRFGRWLQNQITIAKACGCRRVSIIWITPNSCGQ